MGGVAPACPIAGIKPAVGSFHRPPARPARWILEAQHLTTLVVLKTPRKERVGGQWWWRRALTSGTPYSDSSMVNGDAPATRRLPRRRNLVRNALRAVEQFIPREQWMTVVVQ